MRMNSVLPAFLCIAWFIRRAARQARLLGNFHPGWLGCHIIAKLIFVALTKVPGFLAKRASTAYVIRPIVLSDFTPSP